MSIAEWTSPEGSALEVRMKSDRRLMPVMVFQCYTFSKQRLIVNELIFLWNNTP